MKEKLYRPMAISMALVSSAGALACNPSPKPEARSAPKDRNLDGVQATITYDPADGSRTITVLTDERIKRNNTQIKDYCSGYKYYRDDPEGTTFGSQPYFRIQTPEANQACADDTLTPQDPLPDTPLPR